jgi:hypothetical protein
MIKYITGGTVAACAALALGFAASPASAENYMYNYYSTDSEPTLSHQYAPAPNTYLYRAPVYSTPPTTTYYYSPPSTVYVPPATTYHYAAPPPRYYYDPVYAPPFSLQALFSPYSSSSLVNPYRTGPGY